MTHYRSRAPRAAALAACLALLLASWIAPPLRAQGLPQQRLSELGQRAEELNRKGNDWPAAIAACEEWTKAEPNLGVAWFQLGYALHAGGEHERALEAHAKAAKSPAVRAMALYNAACSNARLGRVDAAFESLDASIQSGFADAKTVESDPDLEALRGDERWPAAMRKATPIKKLAEEFRFWVGEWNVFDPQGRQVGTSRIELAENGSLIIEHWSNMQGNTGQSYNFVDPIDRRWRQVWVDAGGAVVRYEGDCVDGAIVFAGTNANPYGTAALARAKFWKEADGSVRQSIQHSTDGGATWTPYFEGVYRARPGSQPSSSS